MRARTVKASEMRKAGRMDAAFFLDEDFIDPEPRHDGSDRFAIYAVDREGERHRIAFTDLRGIGLTLSVLRNEGQITNDDRVGILDRFERLWVVNPWAKGRRRL